MRHQCLIVRMPSAPTVPAPPTDYAALALHGIRPWFAPTLDAARVMLRQWRFDALLLDSDDRCDPLPADFAPARIGLPVLLHCAEAEEAAMLRALERGVADWIVKPAPVALIAAKLRRLAAAAPPLHDDPDVALQIGGLRIDSRRRLACVDHAPLDLSAGEFKLLLLLAANGGRCLSRDTIAGALGSPQGRGRGVDNQVCRIRRQLQASGARDVDLQTVYGEGYRLSQKGIATHVPQGMQRANEERSLA